MTIKQKNELIAAVTALLDKMIPVDEMEPTPITMSKADKIKVTEFGFEAI